MNKKVYIAIGIVGLIAVGVLVWYFVFRKKDTKQEDNKDSKKDKPDFSIKLFIPPLKRPGQYYLGGDVIKNFIGDSDKTEEEDSGESSSDDIDFNTDITEYDYPDNLIVAARLIYMCLDGYDEYCNSVGWRNRWRQVSNRQEIAVINILLHAILETGNNLAADRVRANKNNIFNITGETTYSGSPYIKDYLKHHYEASIIRRDSHDNQKFRSYEYVSDAIFDYLDLINRSPRYQDHVYAYSFNDAYYIWAIGKRGYYTADPSKIAKTIDAMRWKLIKILVNEEDMEYYRNAPVHTGWNP